MGEPRFDPASGKLPYQPWALAARDAYRAGLARGWPGETGEPLYLDPQTWCMKAVSRYVQRPFELVQTPGHVVMMLNWATPARSIPIDGGPHPSQDAMFWMGMHAATGKATHWSSRWLTSTARCGSTASGTSTARTRE